MEIQPPCYADYRKPLNIIADGLCAYLDDLAPFVCAARGLVTDAGWQVQLVLNPSLKVSLIANQRFRMSSDPESYAFFPA